MSVRGCGKPIGVRLIDADADKVASDGAAGVDADGVGGKGRQCRVVQLAPLAEALVGVGRVEPDNNLHGGRLRRQAWRTSAARVFSNVPRAEPGLPRLLGRV